MLTPMCATGGPKWEEGGRVDLGFFDREDAFNEHGRQAEIICLMLLNIPGQKYIEQQSSYVLEMPECVVCENQYVLTSRNGQYNSLSVDVHEVIVDAEM